jgi:L-lactate dehydrogenase complex protein LldG
MAKMKKAREAILSRIRSAVGTASIMKHDDPEAAQKIRKSLRGITPADINGLWDQFKNEFELIAGEFNRVTTGEQAAEIISNLLYEKQLDCIAASREEICSNIISFIKDKFPNIKSYTPDGLSFEERKRKFSQIQAAIVHPTFAVADIGSLVFMYDDTGTSLPHFLCDVTFAVIFKDQILANQFELFEKVDFEKSKNMVFVAGPSRTADIEKVLVLGAHGPRRLIIILIDDLT